MQASAPEIKFREKEPLLDILRLAVLLAFVALYAWNVYRFYWTLPCPSDPLEYMTPVEWKTSYSFWPYFDRLALLINLRIFAMFFAKGYIAGMAYVGCVNTCIVALGVWWAYRKSGFIGAALTGVLFNTSYYLLGWATYIYPDQTIALFSLLAFMVFFSREEKWLKHFQPVFLTGVLAAWAVFSKGLGVAAAFFFLGYLLWRRQWRGLLKFMAGGLAGCLLIFVLFCLLFNYESLKDALKMFLADPRTFGNPAWDNLVSFLDVLISPRYLPVFLGLFIALRAYADEEAQPLFWMAWAYIGWLYFIYTFSVRGGAAIPTYLYSAHVFAALGLGVYFGRVYNQACPVAQVPNLRYAEGCAAGGWKRHWPLALAVLALLLLRSGRKLGMQECPVVRFVYDYHYSYALDTFASGTRVSYPLPVRWLYILGPLAAVGLMCLAEQWRKRRAVAAFMLLLAFWGAAANGGLAYAKTAFDRNEARFYYDAAPVLNEVPAKDFAVLVDSWRGWGRLHVVYSLYFDKKYTRETGYDAYKKNYEEISARMLFLGSEAGLGSLKVNFILTDRPEAVRARFQNVRTLKEIPWRDKTLYVLELLDFQKWSQ